MEREELLGKMSLSATVCLMLLSGKTCSPLVCLWSVYILLGVNTLVLVKTAKKLLTAVPGRVRTNYKLMWAVKSSVFP